jgi:ATP-dependent phosphofructokinase / diphosphate-dependent phosphofructokinase
MARFPTRTRCFGILTSGGDCPGLNSAIRGIAKSAIHDYGMKVIGVRDGFRGLVENRMVRLDYTNTSNVLTVGGTILGTSRDRPKKMLVDGRIVDMTGVAVENARKAGMDCLVCLGGGGTQKNAWHLHKAGGLDVLTLPKTIDNDVAETDVSFGFDTAVQICTEAIDRLHTTATSHDRIIVVEVMGHNAGWLALASGLAGGADVVLIPELPYDTEMVAAYLLERQRVYGRKFSIVVVAEGAITRAEAAEAEASAVNKSKNKAERTATSDDGGESDLSHVSRLVRENLATRLARHLERLTETEARVTSLGHVQRGGVPSAADRLLTTRLGVRAVELLAERIYNVMVAVKGGECVPVPLESVVGRRKQVPFDHDWIRTARRLGTCLGVTEAELLRLID